jgi:hypothetical protein
VCRLGKRHVPRRGIVLLIALWCGACAGCQTRQAPNQHAYIPYARPSEVDLEPAPPVGNSRYRQPHMVNRYQYDRTETDLATPLPLSPR